MNNPLVPEHVPKELVRDYDIYFSPSKRDTWSELGGLHGNYPDVFWTPKGDPLVTPNGTWVVTRMRLIKEVTQNPALFSSKRMTGYAQSVGEDWDLIPLEIDPPEHAYYRTILNPELSPKAVGALIPRLHEYARELIDEFVDKGETEFVSSFGTVYPIGVFFELTGLAKERMPEFFSWVHTLTHTVETVPRQEAVRNIRRVMAEEAAKRRENPTDDLLSRAVNARIDGRALTDNEVTGLFFLLFIGGQDTVTSTMGNMFKYLAEHPEARAKLRAADGQGIVNAVEEFLRMFSVVVGKRLVVQDTELDGVKLKAGDYVTLIYALGCLDPEQFENPMEANFDRTPNPHISFAFGPHRCAGSNLARQELRIALQEWLKRIPDFEIKPGTELVSHSGIYGYTELPLVWKV